MNPQNFPQCLSPLADERRFVVWRWEDTGAAKLTKVPYQVNGKPAKSNDPTTWATAEEVFAVLQTGWYAGAGIELLNLTGIAALDLDKVRNPETGEILLWAQQLVEACNCYTEVTPSGAGLRIIGAVAHSHAPMHTKKSHPDGGEIEFFVQPDTGRFITVTGNKLPAAPDNLVAIDRQIAWIWGIVAPQAAAQPQTHTGGAEPWGPAVGDERAMAFLRGSQAVADLYDNKCVTDPSAARHAVIGSLAKGCNGHREHARRLLLESPLARENDPAKAARDFDNYAWGKAASAGAQEAAQEAQQAAHGAQAVAGMGKPASGQGNDAQPQFDMNFVTGNERPVQMEHLIDPWVPKRTVVGFYGRGESGKSTFASSLCASASNQVSTFWISSEEDLNHVAVRHTHSGGEPNTLITLPASPTKYDKQTGKVTATTFDVYSHLDTAIRDFPKVPGYRQDRPLGIVVLDAINALVTWGKGENANDDASVKRLLGHILTLALNHNLTIIIIGHVNKNTNKEHGADAVTGSAAWTNSLRRAFMFYKDVASDDYEGFVRSAKGNTGTPFASSYKTVPVYTLLKRQNGMDEVLCRVELTSEIVWGERNIAKLLNDSDDEDPTRDKRVKREGRVTLYAIHVAKAIREGATTRDAISAALPKEVGPIYAKYWAKVDRLLQDNHGISVTTTVHGRYEYAVSGHAPARSYTQIGGSIWNR